MDTNVSLVRRMAGTCVVVIAVGALLAGCSDDNPSVEQTGGTSTTLVTDAGSTTTAQSGAGNAGQSGGKSSGGQSGGSATTGGQSAAPAPVVNTFTTPENIDCHNGNSQMFTAEWTTTNATKVTISIDGGGVYKTYAANGEASLPFNCSSAHTFKLTAYGTDGKTTTKSVTLQPRNVQGTDSGTDEP